MCSKIYIHPLFYLLSFLFLLMGNVRYLLLFMSLILVHELGHFFAAKVLGWKVDKICIFPYGGVSKFNEKVNVLLREEFFVLISGPLVQMVFFWVVRDLVGWRYEQIFLEYHLFILGFNLLAIYPLDGGRLLNIFMAIFMPFKKSLKVSVFISYSVLIFLMIFFSVRFSLFFLFVVCATFLKVYEEKEKLPYVFQKFILERRLYTFKFPKKKVIKEKEEMKRDTEHLFKVGNYYYTEKEYLYKKDLI